MRHKITPQLFITHETHVGYCTIFYPKKKVSIKCENRREIAMTGNCFSINVFKESIHDNKLHNKSSNNIHTFTIALHLHTIKYFFMFVASCFGAHFKWSTREKNMLHILWAFRGNREQECEGLGDGIKSAERKFYVAYNFFVCHRGSPSSIYLC